VSETLVLCVVNNRASAPPEHVAANRETLTELPGFAATGPLRLAWVDAASPGNELPPGEGVGLARKLGNDHALALLAQHGADPGAALLYQLDADTRVPGSYLADVAKDFAERDLHAAVVDYAHPLEGDCRAIAAYERYLRYHTLGLAHAGSPYAYPALGSIIVCTANAYARAAGFPRRQAGEDFYFLQKLAKTCGVARIPEVVVRPSARASDRVPFGTGPRVAAWDPARDEDRLLDAPHAYETLRQWLAAVTASPNAGADALLARAEAIEPALGAFLRDEGFARNWERLGANARDAEGAVRAFHGWFDGLKTIRLLHRLRDAAFPRVAAAEAVAGLLRLLGRDDLVEAACADDALDGPPRALETLRALDRDLACRTSGPST
jgi:hypothetical protein